MVTNVTSLTGNGLRDWWIQRATAVYFAVYSIGLFVFFLMHPHLQYTEWHELFHCGAFKVATILALLMISWHTWIGIWTVTTDYLKKTSIRFMAQLLVMLTLITQFVYGLMIVWGQ